MTRIRPTTKEIKALVALLQDDWDSPESLAKACIEALDDARIDRTLYVAVMQFNDKPPVYMGLGPYPGARSAKAAVSAFPGASVARAIGIVPLLSSLGVEAKLREIG